jgi:1-phosphofructokinase family hexose kinase
MILCLNLNAAIDKTLLVSSFEINRIHRPESVISLAGGKGCNVARALKRLGETPVVSGWIGGFSGVFIERELLREEIQSVFVYTDFESRTCTSILDHTKHTLTEIYEIGETIPVNKIDQLIELIKNNIKKYQAITLSGSIPPGVPTDIYAELIEIAGKEDVPAFLDTSAEALRKGMAARPFFVKPNESEVKSILGINEDETINYSQAAGDLAEQYSTNVLLSLGERGAIFANENNRISLQNPRIETKSAVGSGDCTLAGLVHGYLQGLSFEEAAVCGVAAGTANTLIVGAGQFMIEDYERIRHQVIVNNID